MASTNVVVVAVLVALGLAMAAAQYHHHEQESHGHGHAESYASSNLLSTKHEYKHEEPSHKHEHEHVHVEYHSHPKYDFKYGVEDKHTGDYKDQKEERDGDVVKGEYSLLQPDGRKRIVHYTASKHGGFNAIVSYSGHAIHPQVHHHHEEAKHY